MAANAPLFQRAVYGALRAPTRAFRRRLSVGGCTSQQQQQQQQQQAKTSLAAPSATCNRLELLEAHTEAPVPAYQVLSEDGRLLDELDPSLSPQKIVDLYKDMVQLNCMDKVMFDSHRQGRISFYMTNFGEEAAQLGSAAALSADDWVYAQYREAGVLLHRRMDLRLMLAQCFGNREDLGKGRQMPIHYGSRALNFVTISSPLATQMPQAAGSAYALRRAGLKQAVICYFGEGASSEGDAHAALNFAATLDCPVIFFCRNNGYAISTPAREQFRSSGLVQRGLGYGMAAIRVDGNDLFATYAATRRARQEAVEHNRPVLIEAMTYRLGHHSTSDDSSAYRPADELHEWESSGRHPIKRLYGYLLREGLWSEAQDKQEQQAARARVIEALNWAEKVKKLPVSSMFDDVYSHLPANLVGQREQLKQHLAQYGDHYPLAEHEAI